MAEESIRSVCKINLFLQVTGRRSDGYHTLYTLFLPVNELFDTISCDLESAPGIDVVSSVSDVPSGGGNIICKAAELYAERSGIVPSWRFVLDKKIPVAAGLGGGSSNAACVLKALNNKYKVFTEEELMLLASGIGADVPFFLKGVPSWAEGVGDKLFPLDNVLAPLYIVLVNPGFPVGVRWSYSKLDPNSFLPADRSSAAKLTAALISGDIPQAAKLCRNDLGGALWKKFPLLDALKNSMLSAGADAVQISGSGPTLFGVCRSAEVQKAVAEQVRTKFSAHSGMRVFECAV